MIKMFTSSKGLFLSFEGVDGCGKSTQVKLLKGKIESEGRMVELVREPGGLKISEEIRKILLNPDNSSMNYETEALLMTASRAQLTEEVGEVARIISRQYGEQSFKESDKEVDLAAELSDVLFVLLCLANQTGVDLQTSFDNRLNMKAKRDHDRHHSNKKLD